jgi:hypothetical protein
MIERQETQRQVTKRETYEIDAKIHPAAVFSDISQVRETYEIDAKEDLYLTDMGNGFFLVNREYRRSELEEGEELAKKLTVRFADKGLVFSITKLPEVIDPNNLSRVRIVNPNNPFNLQRWGIVARYPAKDKPLAGTIFGLIDRPMMLYSPGTIVATPHGVGIVTECLYSDVMVCFGDKEGNIVDYKLYDQHEVRPIQKDNIVEKHHQATSKHKIRAKKRKNISPMWDWDWGCYIWSILKVLLIYFIILGVYGVIFFIVMEYFT